MVYGNLHESVQTFFQAYGTVLREYVELRRFQRLTDPERQWHHSVRQTLGDATLHEQVAAGLREVVGKGDERANAMNLLRQELSAITARLENITQSASAGGLLTGFFRRLNRPAELKDGVAAGGITIQSLIDLLESIPGLKQILTVLKEGIDVLLLQK